MERITQKHLDGLILRLNRITNSPALPYTKHEDGTGGWIFEPDSCEPEFYPFHQSILFPPEFSPSMILHHPFASGRSGKLIAN